MYPTNPYSLPDNETITTESTSGNITLSPGSTLTLSSGSGDLSLLPGSGIVNLNNATVINANFSGPGNIRAFAVNQSILNNSNTSGLTVINNDIPLGSYTIPANGLANPFLGFSLYALGFIQLQTPPVTFSLGLNSTAGRIIMVTSPSLTTAYNNPQSMEVTCTLVPATSTTGDCFIKVVVYPLIGSSASVFSASGYGIFNNSLAQTVQLLSNFSTAFAGNKIQINSLVLTYF